MVDLSLQDPAKRRRAGKIVAFFDGRSILQFNFSHEKLIVFVPVSRVRGNDGSGTLQLWPN
jgi:hypothetical protein